MPNLENINGPFAWNPVIYPQGSASIIVPSSDADGNFRVDWVADPDESYYELQEGIEQDDLSIVWGAIYTPINNDYYDLVDKPAQTTYWYRVRTVNAGGYSSGWTTSTNGCLVLRPTIYVVPDLGWGNLDLLFDSDVNDKIASFYLDELDIVATEPSYYKTRDTLIFKVSGVNYKVDPSNIDKLGGNGLHYWRYVADPIQRFELSLVSAPVRAGVTLESTVKPRILS